MSPFEIRWQAPEFESAPKDVSWYWISIIVAVLVLGIAVWQRNFLFMVFVVIAEIMVLVWANRESSMVQFTINDKGLKIGERRFHPWSDIINFSVENEDRAFADFTFRIRRVLQPFVHVKAPKSDAARIEAALAPLVEKVDHEDTLTDAFSKLIGF